jgi:hypothetical protein
MPRQLRIPEKYQPSFKLLADMGDTEFAELVAAMSETQPTFHVPPFAAHVAAKLESVTLDTIAKIVVALVPLIGNMSDADDPSSIAAELAQASRDPNQLKFSVKRAKVLQSRLQTLFEIEDSLGAVAKARAIYRSEAHDFCDAKIITDIRPIFRLDASHDPKSAVLVHTLRIGYHENGDEHHHDFTVTVDDAGLEAIGNAVARAREKAQTSVRLIEKSGAQCLSPDTD